MKFLWILSFWVQLCLFWLFSLQMCGLYFKYCQKVPKMWILWRFRYKVFWVIKINIAELKTQTQNERIHRNFKCRFTNYKNVQIFCQTNVVLKQAILGNPRISRASWQVWICKVYLKWPTPTAFRRGVDIENPCSHSRGKLH